MLVRKKGRTKFHDRPRRRSVILPEPQNMTVEEMYRLYPHKWLLVNDPIHREPDYRIVSGELMGVFDAREDAHMEGGRRKLRYRTVINSIQEEL